MPCRPSSPTRFLLPVVLAAALVCTSAAVGPRSAALRADVEGYAMAACLIRRDVLFLREQSYLWGDVVLQRNHGPVEAWTVFADAVGAAAAGRPMPMARGDGAMHDPPKPKPMPLLFCHEFVRTPAVRAAEVRAMRRLAPAHR